MDNIIDYKEQLRIHKLLHSNPYVTRCMFWSFTPLK